MSLILFSLFIYLLILFFVLTNIFIECGNFCIYILKIQIQNIFYHNFAREHFNVEECVRIYELEIIIL